jgi:hypothetical protein
VLGKGRPKISREKGYRQMWNQKRWLIENKISGAGEHVTGPIEKAVQAAADNCTTDASCWTVWALPENVKVAEVTLRGVTWKKQEYFE